MRSSVVARTALIDDWVEASAGEGCEQFVLLGAGFDTRPYRLAQVAHLMTFEVDHPDTQRAKKRTLPKAPQNVRFIGSDFNEGQLTSAMTAAGYDHSRRTLFLWEGVTNYLTEAAVDETLRWCSKAAPESSLIFTYVHSDLLTNPRSYAGTDRLFATLAKDGERLSFGLQPHCVPEFLARRGLRLERDVDAARYRRLYLGEAANSIRGHEFYHVALARVEGPAGMAEGQHP